MKFNNDIYQEEEGSNFESDGKLYDMNKVFQIVHNYKVEFFPVSKLQWVIKYNKADPIRLKNADLNTPIIITDYHGRWLAVDGLHRLTKAVNENKRLIKVKIISPKELEKALIK